VKVGKRSGRQRRRSHRRCIKTLVLFRLNKQETVQKVRELRAQALSSDRDFLEKKGGPKTKKHTITQRDHQNKRCPLTESLAPTFSPQRSEGAARTDNIDTAAMKTQKQKRRIREKRLRKWDQFRVKGVTPNSTFCFKKGANQFATWTMHQGEMKE